MPLTSSITPYNPRWPQQFEEEAARLRPALGAGLIAMHHVGSTSVPDLAAKPEIDVLVVMNDVDQVDDLDKALRSLEYRRGGDLSPGHLFFKRDRGGVRTHKVHVCRLGHPKINEMLRFRDHLRANETVRAEYQALKLGLEAKNETGITEYLAGKAPFIEAVLSSIEQPSNRSKPSK